MARAPRSTKRALPKLTTQPGPSIVSQGSVSHPKPLPRPRTAPVGPRTRRTKQDSPHPYY